MKMYRVIEESGQAFVETLERNDYYATRQEAIVAYRAYQKWRRGVARKQQKQVIDPFVTSVIYSRSRLKKRAR